MDKYLFSDGTNGVREAHSREELLILINSTSAPAQAMVWIFSSHAWISLPAFLAANPDFIIRDKEKGLAGAAVPVEKKNTPKKWWRTPLILTGVVTGALLIFNFSSAKWERSGVLKTTAVRPVNVPVFDLDSLVSEVEFLRGKSLDKSTRNNFRLRNNWPDQILLQLSATKESKGKNTRFRNILVSIDNATGSLLDKAAVRLETWKNGKRSVADTLQFSQIRYDKLLTRELSDDLRADSISVSFLSLQAKAFNFCYQSGTPANGGNAHDRWFCPGGKPVE